MFKTCPQCGDEFLPHVSECPDCRVALVHGEAAGATKAPEAPREAASTALSSGALLRRGEVWELRELAERLAGAGIACAVDTDPPGGRIAVSAGAKGQGKGSSGRSVSLALYVGEDDLAAAAEVHHAWLSEGVPDADTAGPAGVLSACPGCGEPLAESAAACASCGLEFPELEVTCSACGHGISPDAERCPMCGSSP